MSAAPLLQSVPKLMAQSGLPSTFTTWFLPPSTSVATRVPQPTAQKEQTPEVSLALMIRRGAFAARVGILKPRFTRATPLRPVPDSFRKSLRESSMSPLTFSVWQQLVGGITRYKSRVSRKNSKPTPLKASSSKHNLAIHPDPDRCVFKTCRWPGSSPRHSPRDPGLL